MKDHNQHVEKILNNISKDNLFAIAEFSGSFACAGINGSTSFYRHESGIFIVNAVFGLPDNTPCYSNDNSYIIQIHRCRQCILKLPDILGNRGFAFSLNYTEEIKAKELIGLTLSIYATCRKKYETEKIASGIIVATH